MDTSRALRVHSEHKRSAASGRWESGLTLINKHNWSSLFVDSVFTSWIKFICSTQISICRCFCGHVQTCAEWRRFWVTRLMFIKILFVTYLVPCFSCFCACCWWWVHCLKRSSSMLLSGTPKLKKTDVPCGVLDKLHSGMSYSAGGCEFNANESTTYTNYIYPLVCMCVFSPGAVAKNPPANAEDTGSNPGWEDPLGEEITIPSNILAGIIPWTEEPGGLQSMGLQRVRHNWTTEHAHTCVCRY